MSKRKKQVLIIVFVLFVLNLWQWWPVTKQTGLLAEQKISRQIHVNDLSLSGYAIESKDVRTVRRDLFVMPVLKKKGVATEKQSSTKSQKMRISKKVNKTFKQNKEHSGLSRFRLVGILFQNGEKNAYLVMDDKDYSVKKGDEIEGRYLVKEVTVSTVTLLESSTRKSSIVSMQ